MQIGISSINLGPAAFGEIFIFIWVGATLKRHFEISLNNIKKINVLFQGKQRVSIAMITWLISAVYGDSHCLFRES
jgi:hypothetical protein